MEAGERESGAAGFPPRKYIREGPDGLAGLTPMAQPPTGPPRTPPLPRSRTGRPCLPPVPVLAPASEIGKVVRAKCG